MADKPESRVAAAAETKRSTTTLSTAETVEAIRAWTAQHGRVPTEEEWEQAGGGHPSAGAVKRRFGSWKGALAAAGHVLEPGHRPGVRP